MSKGLKIFYGCVIAVILVVLGFFFFYEKPEYVPESVGVDCFETESEVLFNNFVERHELDSSAVLYESQGYFENGEIVQINEVIASDSTVYTHTKTYYNETLTYGILNFEWDYDKPLNVKQNYNIAMILDTLKSKEIELPEHTVVIMRAPKSEEFTYYYFNNGGADILRVNATNCNIEQF